MYFFKDFSQTPLPQIEERHEVLVSDSKLHIIFGLLLCCQHAYVNNGQFQTKAPQLAGANPQLAVANLREKPYYIIIL